MKKFLLSSLLLFTGGFGVYSLTRYFLEKKVNLSSSLVLKILRKIQTLSIHILMKRYDDHHKISNQEKNKDDISIEQVDSNKNKEEEETFDTESSEMLFQIEVGKLNEFKVKPNDYYDKLQSMLSSEKDSQSLIPLIESIKKTFSALQERKLPELKFGEKLQTKYIEIICNIFYFNLKKTVKEYYEKIDSISRKMRYEEKNDIFNSIYRKHLKKTRSEVISFFGMKPEECELSYKLALRIYPFFLDANHSKRKQYNKINEDVNKLITYIVNSEEKIEIFTDKNNKYYIESYINKIIKFNEMLEGKDEKMLIKNKGEVDYEDQFD